MAISKRYGKYKGRAYPMRAKLEFDERSRQMGRPARGSKKKGFSSRSKFLKKSGGSVQGKFSW